MKSLYQIQFGLNVPKNQRNNFGKYNYRSCEDILAAVKPLLNEYECHLTITDEIVVIGDRHYVRATATITDKYAFSCATGFAREAEAKKGMDVAQITGAASSYARKYALNGLFAIDDTKDADFLNRPLKPRPQDESIFDACLGLISQINDGSISGQLVTNVNAVKNDDERLLKAHKYITTLLENQ
ncbi:MAG: ERF family protein [Halanaerobiales bacterium]|nr:ERF family protein [Halanaerobiales bacterium]